MTNLLTDIARDHDVVDSLNLFAIAPLTKHATTTETLGPVV